jgi:flagellar biosynthesis GTPase FlhF
MRVNSVVAVVRAGDDDGEELAFRTRKLRGPEHDRPVEGHRFAQHTRAKAHRLDDVEDLPGALDRRVVLRAKRARRFAFLDQAEVGHWVILPAEELFRPASEALPTGFIQLVTQSSTALWMTVYTRRLVLGREHLPEEGEEGVGRNEPDPPHQPYVDVGERIASVLHAAEQAAEQIRTDARREAEELTAGARQARDEADEYAQDVRSGVDGYANQHRREAEEEARQMLATAEAEAKALREAAQDMARQLEDEGRRRREELRDETRHLEERRKRALEDIREIAAQLEDVIGSAQVSEGGEQALDEALAVRREP